MFSSLDCSQLSAILFSIVTPDSDSTALFHIVDNCEHWFYKNERKAQSNCIHDPTLRDSSLVSSSGVI